MYCIPENMSQNNVNKLILNFQNDFLSIFVQGVWFFHQINWKSKQPMNDINRQINSNFSIENKLENDFSIEKAFCHPENICLGHAGFWNIRNSDSVICLFSIGSFSTVLLTKTYYIWIKKLHRKQKYKSLHSKLNFYCQYFFYFMHIYPI